jgi:hypothetical protein
MRPFCVQTSNSLCAPDVAVELLVFSHLSYLQTGGLPSLFVHRVRK